MKTSRRYRWTFLSAVLCAAVAGVFVAAGPAHAESTGGPGEVCVFLEPDGAGGNGHVGWGYLNTATGTWIYGATENPSGQAIVLGGADIGWWSRSGTRAGMREGFSRQYGYARVDGRYPARAYVSYKCVYTNASYNSAAGSAVNYVRYNGYRVLGWNCMDHSFYVIKAYAYGDPNASGSAGLPSPSSNWKPNDWFNNISGNNHSGKLGETWINPTSGLYLAVDQASKSDWAHIIQWSGNGNDDQWWIRVWHDNGDDGRQNTGDDWYALHNRNSDKCLAVPNGTNEITLLMQYGCNGNLDQQWRYESMGFQHAGWPVYRLRNRNSRLCVDVYGANAALGNPMQQYPCDGTWVQNWY